MTTAPDQTFRAVRLIAAVKAERDRTAYRRALEWVAFNDEPLCHHEPDVARQISTCLVADVWGYKPEQVAKAIVRIRKEDERRQGLEGLV